MDRLRILVVDDESRMRKLVKDFLSKKGYEVLEAADGEQAMEIFYAETSLHLILLDVMMPKMNGWEVVKEIRRVSKVPIIMLTAKGQEQDELMGFDLGVDEYIAKPFSLKILLARIEAVLRRSGHIGEGKLEAGGILVDTDSHSVFVDGNAVELSYKEFELLLYFMKNQGQALQREKILNQVWGYNYYGGDRTIDTHVKKLRNKLKDKGKYIETVWSIGYKFEVK